MKTNLLAILLAFLFFCCSSPSHGGGDTSPGDATSESTQDRSLDTTAVDTLNRGIDNPSTVPMDEYQNLKESARDTTN